MKIERETDTEIQKALDKLLYIEDKISFEKDGIEYKLTLRNNSSILFDQTNLEPIPLLDEIDGGNFWRETDKPHNWGPDWFQKIKKQKKDPNFSQSIDQETLKKYDELNQKIWIFQTDGIYKKLKDGTVAVYALETPSLYNFEEKDELKFFNGANTERFHTEGNTGCGINRHAFNLKGEYSILI